MLKLLNVLVFGMVGLQAIIMLIDEFYFHRRRELGRFERLGHVGDTLMFFITIIVPAIFAPNTQTIAFYIALSLLSCLLITKDEGIHATSCGAGEHWCHAMLFMVHGTILTMIGFLWFLSPEALCLKLFPIPVLFWGLYLHFYWNIYGNRKIAQTPSRQ